MTLAVMTRATLGHLGHTLTADKATTAIYICITLAAGSRVAASFISENKFELFAASALFLYAAFGIFVVHYGRMILAL